MWQRYGMVITVCLACSATLLGHVWLVQHSEHRLAALTTTPFGFTPGDSPWDQPVPDKWLPSAPERVSPTETRPRLLSSAAYETADEDPDSNADVSQPETNQNQPEFRARAVPPLTQRQLDDQAAVRGVIEEEMPETSYEEREIWFEELKSLPAEAVRELLRVRQQMRVLSPDHQFSGPRPLFLANPSPGLIEGPDTPALAIAQRRPAELTGWWETRQALEQAIAWSTHNLSHASTPGYKRVDVLLGDRYRSPLGPQSDVAAPQPVRLGGTIRALRVDASAGMLDARGCELDVAIEGDGWFIVQDSEARKTFYTRCGAWSRNAQGELGLSAGERWYNLEPPVLIPPTAGKIQIDSSGLVTIPGDSENDSQRVGQVELARFANAAQLIPVGYAMYDAPPEAPPMRSVPNAPGFGVLRQGFLEQSNVNPDREQAVRETWEALLRILPVGELSRTARGQGPERN